MAGMAWLPAPLCVLAWWPGGGTCARLLPCVVSHAPGEYVSSTMPTCRVSMRRVRDRLRWPPCRRCTSSRGPHVVLTWSSPGLGASRRTSKAVRQQGRFLLSEWSLGDRHVMVRAVGEPAILTACLGGQCPLGERANHLTVVQPGVVLADRSKLVTLGGQCGVCRAAGGVPATVARPSYRDAICWPAATSTGQ